MEILFRLFCGIIIYAATFTYSSIVRRNLDCGIPQVLTALNGTIKSHKGFDVGHNYGKGLHCVWHIQAPVGWYVELVEDTFAVEGSASNCYRDYLALYDGPSTNSSLIGKFCGSSFSPISSSGRDLTLEFVTNTYTTMAGFKLYYNFTRSRVHSCINTQYLCTNYKCVPQNYRCDGDDDCGDDSDEHNCPPYTCRSNNFPCIKERKCIQISWLCDGDKDCADGSDEIHANCKGGAWKCGNLINNGTSGTIQTPGFPLTSYPNSVDCSFHIYAPNGTTVSLTFDTNFHIETDVKCSYDYVKIYSDGLSNLHGPYCGNTAPAAFTMPSNHVIVEFNSDNSDNFAGFKVTWSAS